MAPRRESPQVLGIQLPPAVHALGRAVLEQRAQVAPVGVRGVGREPAFAGEAFDKPLDALFERRAHAARAAIAPVSSSPMRVRKSVLIVGL